eukprot:SAG25_NODE_10630_length_327_cov_0.881579_1_plen_89_part_00
MPITPFHSLKLAVRVRARACVVVGREHAEELTDYFKAIKQPMDLRTVGEKLRRGDYNMGGHPVLAVRLRAPDLASSPGASSMSVHAVR